MQLLVSVTVLSSSSTLHPTMAVQVDSVRVDVMVRVPDVVMSSVVVVAQMSAVLVLHCSGWLVGYVTTPSRPMLYSVLVSKLLHDQLGEIEGAGCSHVTRGQGPGSVPLIVMPGGNRIVGGGPGGKTPLGNSHRQPPILISFQLIQICHIG